MSYFLFFSHTDCAFSFPISPETIGKQRKTRTWTALKVTGDFFSPLSFYHPFILSPFSFFSFLSSQGMVDIVIVTGSITGSIKGAFKANLNRRDAKTTDRKKACKADLCTEPCIQIRMFSCRAPGRLFWQGGFPAPLK